MIFSVRKWVVFAVLSAPFVLGQAAANPPGAPTSSPSPAIAPNAVAPNAAAPTDASPALASETSPEAEAPRHHKAHKTQPPPPLVLPPLPSGPLSQMPMDQIPPSPAKVTFQGGQLTISAENATLGEILRDVRKLTGAAIEIPSSGAGERVVTHLGPGAPRDVLVALLNGSSFNYVMLGSSADPAAVASVILTPKEGAAGQSPTPAQTASNAYQNNPGMPANRFPGPGPHPFNPGNGAGMAGNPPADEANDEPDTVDDNTNANSEDQNQPVQPVPDVTDANTQAQPGVDPNQPNAGPKTPEQILEMLRRPQQPGGANPQPPPQQ